MNWTKEEKKAFAEVSENERMTPLGDDEIIQLLNFVGLSDHYCPGADYYLWKYNGYTYIWPYGYDEPIYRVSIPWY